MGKCVVKDCNLRSQIDSKANGITFHTIPKDGRREKWIRNIRLLRKETDWLPTKSTRICSKHFHDNDKTCSKSNSERVYLSHEAIPIIVEDLPISENQISCPDKINTDSDYVETDEEIIEATETPHAHEMRKTILRLKSVSEQRLKKIKTLSQKQKRLDAKIKKLQHVIERLKKPQAECKNAA